jgi:hypothetical protein
MQESLQDEGHRKLETRILRENKHCKHCAIASMAPDDVGKVFLDVEVTAKD